MADVKKTFRDVYNEGGQASSIAPTDLIAVQKQSELTVKIGLVSDFADIVIDELDLDSKSDVGHSHVVGDTTGLQTALDGKASTAHAHAIADSTGLQTALDGKAASSHTHAIADSSGLQTALDGKAASSHAHAISDSTGLQTALDGKASASHAHVIGDTAGLQTALDGKAASSHSHSDATTSISGFMPAADKLKLDGIEASANNYSHPASHAISVITGLQDALDGKAADGHTHSNADESSAGFMSALDKAKLNGVEASANNYAHPASHEQSMITGLTDALSGKQDSLGFTPENAANKGAANGYASLGEDGKVPGTQLPAGSTDELVKVGASGTADYLSGDFFEQDETDHITLKSIDISFFNNDEGFIDSSYSHFSDTSNPHGVDKTDVGLGNVPNIDCTDADNISTGTTNKIVTISEFETLSGHLTAENPHGIGAADIIAGTPTGQFLRDDGTWASPSGSGDMTKTVYDSDDDGAIDPESGGTGADSSEASGIPIVTAGVWAFDVDMDDIPNGSSYVKTETNLSSALKTNYDAAYSHSQSSHDYAASSHNHDSAYSAIGHDHDSDYEPIISSKGTAFNKDFGSASGTVCQGNDSRLSDARTPASHGNTYHSETYITSAGVTYEALSGNSDVGTGSAQVAAGNHTHSYKVQTSIVLFPVGEVVTSDDLFKEITGCAYVYRGGAATVLSIRAKQGAPDTGVTQTHLIVKNGTTAMMSELTLDDEEDDFGSGATLSGTPTLADGDSIVLDVTQGSGGDAENLYVEIKIEVACV